ncbi:MAG: glycerophosphodiester phosphodiesterase, partial [Clostridia bacterium]|nr:glycerophosphodiester phosphodiesterase [Clostridia bacterium]
TIHDPEEMRELIELGADGIMTDYPHRLADVYAEYGSAQ